MKRHHYYILMISLILLSLCLLYEYILSYYVYVKLISFSYLEAHIPTQRIRLEDSKGFVDLYYIDKSKNKITERITASYPIEIVTMYDINDFPDTFSLLDVIVKNRFTNCSILSDVQMCKLLIIDEKGKFDYLRGEIFKGKYKGKSFKFMYFIQDAYGYRLDEIDKF